MRVLLLVNERSGRGRARILANALEPALARAGVEFRRIPAPEASADAITALAPSAIVICGGDGAVHHLLQRLHNTPAAHTPLYHLPAGTENLFAREFGFFPRADPVAIARLLLEPRARPIDLALAGQRAFVLMLSLGFDAAIVHRVADARSGPLSRWTYARPILREALRPTLPLLRVRADGRTVIDAGQGLLIIANARQYAARLNPAHNADPSDGALDLIFMPARGALSISRWSALCWARAQYRSRALLAARARDIEIESLDAPAPMQMDGEHAGALPPGDRLNVHVVPSAIRIITPHPPA